MTNEEHIQNVAIARAIEADPSIKMLARFLYSIGDPKHNLDETPLIYIRQAYAIAKEPVQRGMLIEMIKLQG